MRIFLGTVQHLMKNPFINPAWNWLHLVQTAQMQLVNSGHILRENYGVMEVKIRVSQLPLRKFSLLTVDKIT